MSKWYDYLKKKSPHCVTHHSACDCINFKILDTLLDIEQELSVGHTSMGYVKTKELREFFESLR